MKGIYGDFIPKGRLKEVLDPLIPEGWETSWGEPMGFVFMVCIAEKDGYKYKQLSFNQNYELIGITEG